LFSSVFSSSPPLEVVPEAPVIEEVVNLEPSEKVSYSDSTIQEIEISKIVANPYQPRKVFRPEALQELADSIKEHGVIQPVVVTETENGYELVVGKRPLVPNFHIVVDKELYIGITAQEPQQFVNNRFDVHFFCGHERVTLGKVETHLIAKNAPGACPSAIVLLHPVIN
jgi:hypothetical protein